MHVPLIHRQSRHILVFLIGIHLWFCSSIVYWTINAPMHAKTKESWDLVTTVEPHHQGQAFSNNYNIVIVYGDSLMVCPICMNNKCPPKT